MRVKTDAGQMLGVRRDSTHIHSFSASGCGIRYKVHL